MGQGSWGIAKDGSSRVKEGYGCSLSCQRALTQKRTLGRRFECPSSLLERLQGRIALEALGERGSSFGTEAVVLETVRERWGENGQKAGVSAGADMKANAFGAAAHSSEVTELPLSPSHSLVMPSAV